MIFEENKTVWWSRLLWAIAIGDIVLGGYMWQKIGVDLFSTPAGWIGLGALFITFVAVMIGAVVFSRYFVTFDGERLGFGFTKLNGHVSLESIESVKIIPHVNLLKFGGVGWRFDFGGKKIGFLANKGAAIEITPKGGNWCYVFNCDDAERLVGLLAEAGVET